MIHAMSATTSYRLAVGLAVATMLFLVLAAGALGILGSGGRPDRVYVAVLAVGIFGALVARLRARAMAMAMVATAFTQVLVTAVALIAGLPPEGASVVDIIGINAMYAGLFAAAAWLFWRAGADRQNGVSAPA
jgi:hypothetical protein